MASDPANSRRNAAKWGVAGALAVVLVAVVAWQIFGGRGGAPARGAGNLADDKAEQSSRRSPRKFPTKGFPLTQAERTPTHWPAIPLARAIAHDPFAPELLPSAAPAAGGASGNDAELAAQQQQRAALLAETLDALRQRGVTMVLHTTAGPVATIGDRTIKVGDTIGDYRVTEIDADGVVLEPTPPK